MTGHATNMIMLSDWTINGTFNHNNGKVTFEGLTGTTSRILGSSVTSFYDITVDNLATYTLRAHPTEMRIAHNFVLTSSNFDANYPSQGNGGDGLVTFNGTSVITVTGSSLAFNHITISGTVTFPGSTVNVYGNWINNGTYNNNSQMVLFRSQTSPSGSDAVAAGTARNQVINGSQVSTFYNLTYNNPAATSSLTLNQNVIVSNQLDLRAGALMLNTYDLTLSNSTVNSTSYDQAAGTIVRRGAVTSSLGTGTGYIVSEDVSLTGGRANNSSIVNWAIGSTTGIHAIPFANTSGNLIPLIFNLTSGNTGTVSFATYGSNAANTPFPQPVNHVSDTLGFSVDNSANTVDRYWAIAQTGSGIANVTFTYTDAEVPGNGETEVMVKDLELNNGTELITGVDTLLAKFLMLLPTLFR